jgi:hypothetical protein
LETQLTKDGQAVIATPPSAISIQGVSDFARIPFIGSFLSTLSNRADELKLAITDLLTRASASARSTFTLQ